MVDLLANLGIFAHSLKNLLLLISILKITPFLQFLNTSHIKIPLRKILRLQILHKHQTSDPHSIPRHTSAHIRSVSYQTISTGDLSSWHVLGILLNFQRLSINHLRVRHCHIRIVWTALVHPRLPRTDGRDVRELTRRQLDYSSRQAIPTLQFQLRGLDIGFCGADYNPTYNKNPGNKTTSHISNFFSILVATNNYLPFILLCVGKLLTLLSHIGSNSFLHHSQHIQRIRDKLLKQLLFVGLKITELEIKDQFILLQLQ